MMLPYTYHKSANSPVAEEYPQDAWFINELVNALKSTYCKNPNVLICVSVLYILCVTVCDF